MNDDLLIPGQVWRSEFLNEYVMITSIVNDYEVRAVVLCPVDNFGDGKDIIFTPNEDLKLYMPQKRVALRVTNSPIPISDLIFKIGNLTPSTVKKVIESLTDVQYDYTDYALKSINQYKRLLDLLQSVHQEPAPEAVLKQRSDYNSIPVVILDFLRKTKSAFLELTEPDTTYLLAGANDITVSKAYSKLVVNEILCEKRQTVYSDETTEVRLSLLQGVLYFAVFSRTIASVSDIKLSIGESELSTTHKKIKLQSNHAIVPFGKGILPKNKAGRLSFRLDRKLITVEVEVR